MKFASSNWLKVALSLNTSTNQSGRYSQLLETIRQAVNSDASALLVFKDQKFIPVATKGLNEDVLGRRFDIDDHPRLEAIARAGDIVRFPEDSSLPDPYDGLIEHFDGRLDIHSCVGMPLLIDGNLIGAVTIDAFASRQFDDFPDDDLRVISALAASGLYSALLKEKLSKLSVFESQPNTEPQVYEQEMIGTSSQIEDLRSQIEAVANIDLSVLVMGETGVGKELVAKSIHQNSSRSTENLVYLNCAALPDSVTESELFGHIKGAFTGAISNRKGKFELADKGTLFLDEIGEISLTLQAKLLRALQYGDIQRVGSDKAIKVNCRIVAATNRNLHKEVTERRFRADLYHRLSVFPIAVPPLRERENDAVLLAGFFAEKFKQKLNLKSVSLGSEVLEKIKSYSWPGNVRELEHVISRALVIAKSSEDSGQIHLTASHLMLPNNTLQRGSSESEQEPLSATSYEFSQGLKHVTDSFQRKVIEECYNKNGQNWAATARELKVDNGNLHRLAKRLALKS